MTAVCVSAPGKVLLTGGYLVLHRPHQGLVITVSSRFHTFIEAVPPPGAYKAVPTVSSDEGVPIEVHSPQLGESLSYKYSLSKGLEPSHKNPYVDVTLRHTLAAIVSELGGQGLEEKLGAGILITLAADNQYYSQRDRFTKNRHAFLSSSYHKLQPFLPPSENPEGSSVPKTGLGSSAGLVTSLVGALIQYCGVVQLPDEKGTSTDRFEDLHMLHGLAQLCHCEAQGKVGSGFDVSAAVYGSQTYVRFSPSAIQELLAKSSVKRLEGSAILSTIRDMEAWDQVIESTALPRGMHLIVAESGLGSNTPSMVGKVLAWKSDKAEEATKLWSTLDYYNKLVKMYLEKLSSMAKSDTDYDQQMEQCAAAASSEWSSCNAVGEVLHQLRDSGQQIRKRMKEMGDRAGVPIEPDQQSELLDFTEKQQGVVICGVPGAGGFDAVFVVVIGSSSRESLEKLWLESPSVNPCPISVEEDSRGVMVEEPPFPGAKVLRSRTIA